MYIYNLNVNIFDIEFTHLNPQTTETLTSNNQYYTNLPLFSVKITTNNFLKQWETSLQRHQILTFYINDLEESQWVFSTDRFANAIQESADGETLIFTFSQVDINTNAALWPSILMKYNSSFAIGFYDPMYGMRPETPAEYRFTFTASGIKSDQIDYPYIEKLNLNIETMAVDTEEGNILFLTNKYIPFYQNYIYADVDIIIPTSFAIVISELSRSKLQQIVANIQLIDSYNNIYDIASITPNMSDWRQSGWQRLRVEVNNEIFSNLTSNAQVVCNIQVGEGFDGQTSELIIEPLSSLIQAYYQNRLQTCVIVDSIGQICDLKYNITFCSKNSIGVKIRNNSCDDKSPDV